MTSEKIKDGVRKVLLDHPECRNSYNWLWYWYCCDILKLKIYIPYQVLDNGVIPSVESITRAARKIFEEARTQETYNSAILPDLYIQEKRQENEKRVREWATKPYKGSFLSLGGD